MTAFYPQLHALHVAMILASGSLFALRGVFALAGSGWPLSRPARRLSYAVDTTLLTAAVLLLCILPWSAFANGWLLVKLGLLVAYVLLGYRALRPGRDLRVRVVLFMLALLTYGWMYTIARAHHPLGILRALHSG